jgi:hypothetical protein
MSAVQPRYQDRRACPKCGSLLARWCSEVADDDGEGGHVVNTPGLGSPRWVEGHLRPGDIIEHTLEVAAGRTSDTKTIRSVRYDYFCETCNEDLYPSLTVPWSGDLPASAYYEPESPDDRRARFARSRAAFEKTLVEE